MKQIHYMADETISLKAKGLLALLLILPDDADKSVAALGEYCSDGHTSIISGLRELERLGYIKRGRMRSPAGIIGGVSIRAQNVRNVEG